MHLLTRHQQRDLQARLAPHRAPRREPQIPASVCQPRPGVMSEDSLYSPAVGGFGWKNPSAASRLLSNVYLNTYPSVAALAQCALQPRIPQPSRYPDCSRQAQSSSLFYGGTMLAANATLRYPLMLKANCSM